jgi:hypothetical protein
VAVLTEGTYSLLIPSMPHLPLSTLNEAPVNLELKGFEACGVCYF